jgi:murein L,D-transpeptidase YcbB/YkuD
MFSAIVAVIVFGGIGTLLLTYSHAATTCAEQTFGQGNSGKCVEDIQQMLNGFVAAHALYPSAYNYTGTTLNTSGIFSSDTVTQVRYFQSKHQVGIDGIVGNVTWESLCLALKHLPYGKVAPTSANKQEQAVVVAALAARVNSQCHN